MAVQEEVFRKRYIPKGGGKYDIEHEEMEPVEYSGWVRPSLPGISWDGVARFLVLVAGMAACWEITSHGVGAILDQVNGAHSCTFVIGR